jgi:hypothetical protein
MDLMNLLGFENNNEDQKGDGRYVSPQQSKIEGLYDSQIDKMMIPRYRKKGYCGCIAANEIPELAEFVNTHDRMAWIQNTANRNEEGKHWVACYISFIPAENQSYQVCYYDPLGDPATPNTLREIKNLINKRKDLDVLLKYKENRVQRQSATTETCGLHCINFLEDMFGGESFKEASGYSKIMKNEKAAEDTFSKMKRFGYL